MNWRSCGESDHVFGAENPPETPLLVIANAPIAMLPGNDRSGSGA